MKFGRMVLVKRYFLIQREQTQLLALSNLTFSIFIYIFWGSIVARLLLSIIHI